MKKITKMAAMMNTNNYLLKYANFWADPLFSLGAAHPWYDISSTVVGTIASKFAVADGGMSGNMVTAVPGDFHVFIAPYSVLQTKNIAGTDVYASFWMKGLDAEPKAAFQLDDIANGIIAVSYGAAECTASMAGWTFIEGLIPIPANFGEFGAIALNFVGTTINQASLCNVTMRPGKHVDTAAQFTLYNP